MQFKIKEMKYIIISLFSVYCLVLFQSCSNDDIPLEDVETSIAYQITCDDPNAQIGRASCRERVSAPV